MTRGDDVLHFLYDAQNSPVALLYNGDWFAYVKNLQGDVIGITNAGGTKVVEYAYDAWGKPIDVTGTMSGTLGAVNPFRYRGYVYDGETGLYYLRSRYYRPEWGRFVNADTLIAQVGCLHGNDLYTYTFNNPIANNDSDGDWPDLRAVFTAIAVVAAVVVVAAAVVVTCGVSAPALAVAGTGIVTATSGTATTTAVVSCVAATVACTSTVVSAVSNEVDRRRQTNNTVYRLVDNEGVTQYVGRTTNVPARMAAHSTNPHRAGLEFVIIRDGLNYYEARGLEQIAMLSYHTVNPMNRMNNQINGISSRNRFLRVYMEAGRGVSSYLENQVTNEILYWTGR